MRRPPPASGPQLDSRHEGRSISVNLPIEMDDGSVHSFHGYRVAHNQLLGPSKGGIQCDAKSTSEGRLCTDLRTAALAEALDRLARVTPQRGIRP